jgi:hypothetical protein
MTYDERDSSRDFVQEGISGLPIATVVDSLHKLG